jgi:tetratricopeptide (TPR) repeat protein
VQWHADLLAKTGHIEQALDELDDLRKQWPNRPEILSQIGALQLASGHLNRALEVYDHWLMLEPNNPSAHASRAEVRTKLGQEAGAVADYRAALAIDPHNNGVQNNLAWIMATSPNDQLRDGPQAVQLAMAACESTKSAHASYLGTLAAAYAETSDFDAAIALSTRAIERASPAQREQLAKELSSYRAHKPWRGVAAMPADAAEVNRPKSKE